MCIQISSFHSITSVSLDKVYQGSRIFSEQKFRFPWHKMKFTINWLFCPYRSNQHRSWTVLHSHLLYWSTVILSNRKNGKKHTRHNKKQVPPSLFLQTGNLLSSSCVSIRIFNLTSQIDIEWCRLLFHGLLGDRFMVWISPVLKTMGWLCWPSLPGEGIWYQSNIFLLFYESQKFT
jgi:hypothetical protein